MRSCSRRTLLESRNSVTQKQAGSIRCGNCYLSAPDALRLKIQMSLLLLYVAKSADDSEPVTARLLAAELARAVSVKVNCERQRLLARMRQCSRPSEKGRTTTPGRGRPPRPAQQPPATLQTTKPRSRRQLSLRPEEAR